MDSECFCYELSRPRQHRLVAFRLEALVWPGDGADNKFVLGLWRHPENRSQEYTNLDYWLDLARTAEEAKFNGLFIADMLGIYDVYKGPGNIDPVLAGAAQFPISDPL